MKISRRSMLKSSGAFAGMMLSGSAPDLFASGSFQVHEIKTITNQPNYYHGWPTVGQTADGELLAVCSGGRESHVCPFGRVELIRSSDQGKTWSHQRVLLDGPIDDRDAGILVTAQGTILVTTFTSLAYDDHYIKNDKIKDFAKDRKNRWLAAHNRIPEEKRQKDLGCWMIRSTDGGITWSERYNSIVNSPHGPIQLSDGRLLYPGATLWADERKVGVCESTDDGKTWKWLSGINPRPGDKETDYHELHGVEARDGTIIVQIRNHNPNNERETLQCESKDGGKTWSEPHSIGVWGLPSHLIRLKDDRLLMTYGHRRKPLGNQARVSEDNGKTWSEAMILDGNATSGDLGYPSTTQLSDGSLITVWYERMKSSPMAVLRQAHWTL